MTKPTCGKADNAGSYEVGQQSYNLPHTPHTYSYYKYDDYYC